MTFVWLIYLQLFLREHKRHNSPFLIIHHAQGCDPSSLCLVVNMSQEPVHVLCVIADVYTAHGRIRHDVTDYRRITPDDRNVQAKLRQGPIQSGGYLTLGSFENIILGHQSVDDDGLSDDDITDLYDVESLDIIVAVNHGPTQSPIGARRRFIVERDEDCEVIVRAVEIDTEQLSKKQDQKEVRDWVASRLIPKRKDKEAHDKTPDNAD